MTTTKKPASAAPKRRRAARASAPVPSEPPGPIAVPTPPEEPAPTDTELAFLALYAEDAFQTARGVPGADLTRPAPDPRLKPKWTVVGALTGEDALFRLGRRKVGARRVFYGWLLRSEGGRLVLAIRGTADATEWWIDMAFAPRRAHPVAGRVESGFWDVFSSMLLDGKPITDAVRVGTEIAVVGHSLGAAIATYASLELARAGAKVRGVFVASPHPGDAVFCKAFGEKVPNHVMYRNQGDLVPRVPLWFGYSDVPNVKTLSAAEAGIKVTGGYPGRHHLLTYIALSDQRALKSFRALPCDQRFLDCIRAAWAARVLSS